MLCKYPIPNKNAGGIVPCGQCFPCRLDLRRKWTFRLLLENRLHDHACWISLTYNNEYVPHSYYNRKTGEIFEGPPESFNTLSPLDLELFIKKVRKQLPPKSLRYYICGEYGEDFSRPHYHCIFFGFNGRTMLPIVQDAWSTPYTKNPLGFVRLDAEYLTPDIAQYTCGYTVKKMTKTTDERLNGRYPEFTRHSLGIGRGAAAALARALDTESGWSSINTMVDIPRVLGFDGRSWPIDRYLRELILDELSVKPQLQKAGFDRYKKEMRALQFRHKPDPRFASSLDYILTKQYSSETAQKILNTESKASLKPTKDKL
jgi:hypothetical protein